ncbi:MAG: sigma-70 family RNA polymerase sigma factor [Deltaproteobacteria bacterium]|nr:sigma-70 family RNA polymerase sigma factor [Deltaproteobacteria bacterium]
MAEAGARERFAGLLAQHRGIVVKVAHTFAASAEDRADLAQEIAAQLWRSFPRYDASRPFATWMYRVALNVGVSYLRGRERRGVAEPLDAESVASQTSPDESLEDARRAHALERAIARLARLDRALLLLHLDERSQREIGEVLGISESNVATKLSRLRQRLRGELSGGKS